MSDETTPKKSKQQLGGAAVVEKYGTEYMRKIGKKGRKKQLSSNRVGASV